MKKRINVRVPVVGLESKSTEFDTMSQDVVFFADGSIRSREEYEGMSGDGSPSLGNAVSANAVEFGGNIVVCYQGDGGATAGSLAIYPDITPIPDASAQPVSTEPDFWCDFAQMSGKLICSMGWHAVNRPQVVASTNNGTDMVLQRHDYPQLTPLGAPLKFGLCCEHRGVLFIGRVFDDDGFVQNRIRWSDLGAPENLNPGGSFQNFEDIGEEDDPIIRLVSFNNDLIIFKKQSVWLATDFTVVNNMLAPNIIRQISHELGMVGPNAMSKNEKYIFFLSGMGLFRYDGNEFVDIGGNLAAVFRVRERSAWEMAFVNWEDNMNRLHVGLPPVGGGYAMEIYVQNEDKRWSRWTPDSDSRIAAMSLMTLRLDNDDYIGLILLKSFSGTCVLYQRNAGLSCARGVVATHWMDLGQAGMKQLRALELLIGNDGDFPLTVNIYSEFSQAPVFTGTVSCLAPDHAVFDTTELGATGPTANKDTFFPVILDTPVGSIRRLKYVFSGPKINIKELKASYIKGTGI